jgi:cell division protein FtsZ
MIEMGVKGVTFIAVNTDSQALNRCNADIKLTIGKKVTHGLGAGGDPDMGEQAAMEDQEAISNAIKGAHMVFVTAGMGGGTGTGSAPVIARIARENNVLTVGVITKPFLFEGRKKMALAEEGIAKMREVVDTLIIIPNQNLMGIADRNTTLKESFLKADDVLRQGVQGISDLIINPGIMNIDFADVRTTMQNNGDALMGVGFGTGDHRAEEAAAAALENPLLEDSSIEGAKHILVNVSGSENLGALEYQEIMDYITQNADQDAHIIIGMAVDPSLGEKIQVTVIATGFKTVGAAMPHVSKKEESVTQLSDWENILGSYPMSGSSLQGSFSSNDLEVPAVLRYSRAREKQGGKTG